MQNVNYMNNNCAYLVNIRWLILTNPGLGYEVHWVLNLLLGPIISILPLF